MRNERLKRQCLAVLGTARDVDKGLSTRDIADALDISVYKTRLLLLDLEKEGRVKALPREKPWRGAARRWAGR
ncbi:UNVERIFIED_ORG: orotate phosphoribosyltransferase-like protein [Pantoea agglomerans]